MLFHTATFAAFFVTVFFLNEITKPLVRLRELMLVVASFIFYAAWDWRFCFLLGGSAIFNHYAGMLLASREGGRRRMILAIAIAANLAVLGFFKYFNFFIESFNELLYSIGDYEGLTFLDIILPVGISFFTFQGISYIVDVHQEKVAPSRRLLETTLYLSFFPQLVAGPIVRAADFLPQLRDLSRPRQVALGFAVVMILGGLFKKIVVANYIATDIVDEVFQYPADYGFTDLALAAYGYSVQIYSDFSGYSDMAIGFAALLGFHIPLNFNRPFAAHSISDFWRRWHISLSTWLRDYLYIPLGGSRLSRLLTMRNLFITMLLGGLWHGAAWTFILWGAIHGALLIAGRLTPTLSGVLGRILGVFVTLHLVVLTFVLFRCERIEDFWAYLDGLTRFDIETQVATPFVAALIAFGLIMHWIGDLRAVLVRAFAALPWPVLAIVTTLLLTIIVAIAPDEVTPFIYFQF